MSILSRQNDAVSRLGPTCRFLRLRQQGMARHTPGGMLQAAPHHPMPPSLHNEARREERFPSPATTQSLENSFDNVPIRGGRAVDPVPSEYPDTIKAQEACPYCNRLFDADRVERHALICAHGTAKSQRREFDSKKVRVRQLYGEANATTVLQKLGEKEVDTPRRNDWRKQSAQFQQLMRNNGQKPATPQDEEVDDRVPCPGCGRRFAATVAERHIPKCTHKVESIRL